MHSYEAIWIPTLAGSLVLGLGFLLYALEALHGTLSGVFREVGADAALADRYVDQADQGKKKLFAPSTRQKQEPGTPSKRNQSKEPEQAQQKVCYLQLSMTLCIQLSRKSCIMLKRSVARGFVQRQFSTTCRMRARTQKRALLQYLWSCAGAMSAAVSEPTRQQSQRSSSTPAAAPFIHERLWQSWDPAGQVKSQH